MERISIIQKIKASDRVNKSFGKCDIAIFPPDQIDQEDASN